MPFGRAMAIKCPTDPPVMLITYRLQLEASVCISIGQCDTSSHFNWAILDSFHSWVITPLWLNNDSISWVRNQSDKKIESWVESESSHADRHFVQSWVPGKLSPSWLAYPLKGMKIFGVPTYILQRKNIQIHTITPTSMAVWREMRRRTMSPMSWGEPRLL